MTTARDALRRAHGGGPRGQVQVRQIVPAVTMGGPMQAFRSSIRNHEDDAP